MRREASAGTRSVVAALIGNLLVATTKAIAAYVTGSAAMASETVHSVVDSANQLLLFYGIRRSRLSPDELHPDRLWPRALFLELHRRFAAVRRGRLRVRIRGHHAPPAPRADREPRCLLCRPWTVALFEGSTLTYAYRNFRANIDGRGFWHAIRESRDPPQTMVLMEDSAAITGICIALLGTWLATSFGLLIFRRRGVDRHRDCPCRGFDRACAPDQEFADRRTGRREASENGFRACTGDAGRRLPEQSDHRSGRARPGHRLAQPGVRRCASTCPRSSGSSPSSRSAFAKRGRTSSWCS